MINNRRYTFSRIFWILLAIYVFLGVVGLVFLSMMTLPESISIKQIYNVKYFVSQGAGLIFSTFYYYFTLNKFYELIANRKPFADYLPVTILSSLASGTFFYLSTIIFKTEKVIIGINPKGHSIPFGLMVFAGLFTALFFIGVSMLVAYLTFLRDEKKQRKILEAQKMQLEVEKSQANFNFLKAQINPHFLHNTLNFLYSKALPLSPELSEGILTLSDIMRYALSEGNARDGKAPLKDEIEHVRNVIKIQQLRFNNNLNVQFDVEGVINGATIIPFVLITLVENAFKHGDLKASSSPIVIKLNVQQNKLYFYCQNKKKTGAKELSTGIGLNNIKKRLDLAYGESYHFNIKDETDLYTTELFIDAL